MFSTTRRAGEGETEEAGPERRESCGVNAVFRHRKVKTRNLWEYTGTRTSLLSKRIYLLVSAQVAPGDARGTCS